MFDKLTKISILLALVFLISCSSEQMVKSKKDVDKLVKSQRELITDNVKDSQTQTELLEIVNAMNLDGMKFMTYYTEHRNKVTELIKDYNISRPDFEAELADINNHYEAYLKSQLQKQKEMRSLTTKEEWTNITDWDNTLVPE